MANPVFKMTQYQKFIDELAKNIPNSWDDEGPIENVIIDYVRQLELRVDELGGSLERHPVEIVESHELCYGLNVPHKRGLHPGQCTGCLTWLTIEKLK